MPSTTPGSVKRGEPLPCTGLDPDLFFPKTDGTDFRRPTAAERLALAVCGRCPLARRDACLREALRHPAHEQYGVVGAATAAQRRVIIRGREASRQLGVAA
ncbi:WhiB family transcriptional regulator [Kitasatospora sp. NPDC056327]|uniref:WhiB family transcriptional regulator n=1 Tax=Kitasatospora sp. NPDC056327 TaxID=3345785 RepID=UPI0035DCBEB8